MLADAPAPSRVASAEDARFMAATIALGRTALGLAAPNPAVGALVVRDGVVIGSGATRRGGRPHAETEALRVAGERARGATLYVSLEPCSHHGKTPPCVDAILAAGVTRVVSALDDPDPRVAGRGHRLLREAGVEVVTGVGADQARRANLGHILRATRNRPLVTLKLAQTADGYAAGDEHDPRLMITGQAANNRVQMMRATHDAIMIGVGTARADDPLLTVRLPGMDDRRPLRIVLDTHLSLSPRSRLVATAHERATLIIAGAGGAQDKAAHEKAARLTEAGVEIVRVETGADGHVDLRAALRMLAQRGVTRVFSEGGPHVAAALIGEGLADEVALLTSPKPLARVGVVALDPASRAALKDGARYRPSHDGRVGIDRLQIFERLD